MTRRNCFLRKSLGHGVTLNHRLEGNSEDVNMMDSNLDGAKASRTNFLGDNGRCDGQRRASAVFGRVTSHKSTRWTERDPNAKVLPKTWLGHFEVRSTPDSSIKASQLCFLNVHGNTFEYKMPETDIF